MTASGTIVSDTLMASIPPGSPPMFKRIVHAHSSSSGRNKKIFADLVMFDDQHGSVLLEPFQWGWSIQWMQLPGGAFMLQDGAWMRDGGVA